MIFAVCLSILSGLSNLATAQNVPQDKLSPQLVLQSDPNTEYFSGVDNLAWSHNGKWLAAASGKSMAYRGELFVYNTAGEVVASHAAHGFGPLLGCAVREVVARGQGSQDPTGTLVSSQ